jgi:PAS domain S-box-containing protein
MYLSRLPLSLSRQSFLRTPLTWIASGYVLLYLLWWVSGISFRRPELLYLADYACVPINLAGCIAFFRAASKPRIDRRLRQAFIWFGLAMVALAIGNASWGLTRAEGGALAWANIPFILYFPLSIFGFFAFVRAQRREIDWRSLLLDSAIVLISMALVVWFFVVRRMLPTYDNAFDTFLGLAYPAGDLAVLVLLLSLMLRPGSVVNPRAYRILVIGFAGNAVADLAYDLASRSVPSGVINWADVLYMVSYFALLWGAELYWRRPLLPIQTPPGPLSVREWPVLAPTSSIPVVTAAAAGFIVVLLAVREVASTANLLALGMVFLSALLVIRETRAVRENARLQHELGERARDVRFEALVQYSSDVVIVIDASLAVRYVSPAIQRVLGVAPLVLIDRPLTELLHPDDRGNGDEFLAESLLHPASTATAHWRLRHAGGEWRAMEAVASNLLSEPYVRGVVLTLRDVTDREHLEEQLRQAQKMEAIGQLAGGVAHDFNNLLTTVIASSDMALEQLPLGSPASSDIEEIRHAATRASALTGQLLALSRKQMVEPRTLDFGRVIAETSRLLERLLGEQVRLVTTVALDLGAVRADRGQIEQVLLNLSVNARDAMPNGGTLVMRASNLTLETTLATRFMDVHPGDYVLLEVQDTGAGMDEGTLPRIFEPFFTTKPQGKGTGLGLASVYGIVRQSGGAITADSTPGHGTVFRVYLPRVAADPPAQEVPPLPRSEAGTETILLVEDEPALMCVGQRILQAVGYTVLAASDAEDALRQAGGWTGTIDLLLTDVIMPGDTGPVLARRLLRQRPGLRVLYMSGYAGDELGEHGVLEPGVALLQKPFTARELAARVRDALGDLPAPQPASQAS